MEFLGSCNLLRCVRFPEGAAGYLGEFYIIRHQARIYFARAFKFSGTNFTNCAIEIILLFGFYLPGDPDPRITFA